MADDDTDDEAPDDKFQKHFNMLFHRAMSERDGRLEKSLAKKFEGLLAGKFDELRTMLADSSSVDDDDLDTDAGTGESGKDTSPEVRARLLRMDREYKEMKDKADSFERQWQTEKDARARQEERQELQSVLGPLVKSKMLGIAVDQLHARNLIRDEETGTILWRSEDGTTLPLKDGVSNWAKSDVGKEFAPPVEARGRGSRGPEGVNGMQAGKMTVETLGDIVTGSIPGQRG